MLSILLVVGLVTTAAGYAAGYLAGYDDGFGKRQMSDRPAGLPIDWATPENQAQLRRAFPEADLPAAAAK